MSRACFQTRKDRDMGGLTEILRDPPVEFLLADVSLPGMHGVELNRVTRQTRPNLITLLRPAHAADDILQQGLAKGIKTGVTSPWISTCFSPNFRRL